MEATKNRSRPNKNRTGANINLSEMAKRQKMPLKKSLF
jgi:hypothetical protein